MWGPAAYLLNDRSDRSSVGVPFRRSVSDTSVRLGNRNASTRGVPVSRVGHPWSSSHSSSSDRSSPRRRSRGLILAVGVVGRCPPSWSRNAAGTSGAAVLMLIALVTAPFDSTAIMALPIYAAALVARSASDDTLRLRLSVITVPL